MRRWLALVGAVATACGTPAMTATDAPGDDDDDAGDAPAGCTKPSLDDAALATQLSTWLSQLPAPRATIEQRANARTYLQAELTALGLDPTLHIYNNGANVVATLPATHETSTHEMSTHEMSTHEMSMMGSGKGIIVGAHFDTVANSPGANDNASGTVVVLAVARLLADTPCRTAPVTVAFFDQEELGLFGARAYARSLSAAEIRAVHTIDQVAFDDDGDRGFELEAPTATLETEWQAAATVIGVPVTTETTEGTDHEAFRELGFAAIGLTEEFVGGDTSPFRHTAQDTVSTVDTAYLTLAMKLTAQVVIEQVSP